MINHKLRILSIDITNGDVSSFLYNIYGTIALIFHNRKDTKGTFIMFLYHLCFYYHNFPEMIKATQ